VRHPSPSGFDSPAGFDGPAGFDALVVGAGPAGSAAAFALAKAGMSVLIVERGPYPGSKNVYGGVVYGRILDQIDPLWWQSVPVQRWVVRRSTMVLTSSQSVSFDVRSQAWGGPPHNGMTVYRADFDSWLADKAVAEGARLVCSTVATGLLRDGNGRVCGVRTDRPGGELHAKVVIAADGVNSFLAKSAGLHRDVSTSHFTLGVKEVLDMEPEMIESRFGLSAREGLDIEALGATGGIPGGGFLYTNHDSVSVGVVVALDGLAASKRRPEELVAAFKAHPSIAPYLRHATLREYSAHLIPEGGYDSMPDLVADGLLVAGDAAGMTLAAGLWLEGVNFAVGAGLAAGRAAARAIEAGDTTARGLGGYRRELETSFVLADHLRLRRAPALVLSDRVQGVYNKVLCDVAEQMFTVGNPAPKPGLLSLARRSMRTHGLKLRHVAKDGLEAARTFR